MRKLVDGGNYVTGVSKSGDNLVFTMSNGSPIEISGVVNEQAKPSSLVTINKETGEIEIDGKGTGFFASQKGEEGKPAEVKVPFVKDGQLVLIDKDGNEVETGIRVAPVTAVQNENGSWTLTITDAKGNSQKVEVPSAASMISSIEVKEAELTLKSYQFNFKWTGKKRADWKGSKTLPADKTEIVAGDNTLSVTLTPVTVDAKELDFTLTDSKLNTPANVSFTVADDDKLIHGAGTRANQNGKYTLSFNQVELANEVAKKAFDDQFYTTESGTKYDIKYALNANKSFHSEYSITVPKVEAGTVTTIDAEIKNLGTGNTVKVGETYQVSSKDEAKTYDMFYSVSEADAKLFGIVSGDKPNTFKVTANPETLTKAGFTIKAYVMNLKGEVKETSFTLNLSTELTATCIYDPVEFTINPVAKKNYISVDLAKMKESLGDKLTIWNKAAASWNVDFASTLDKAKENTCDLAGSVQVFGKDVALVEKVKESAQSGTYTFGVDQNPKNNFIKWEIDNEASHSVKLDVTFYAVVKFHSAEGTLNTVIVPVTLHAPALSTLFAPLPGYLDATEKDVINAYMYLDKDNKAVSAVDLSRYFDKENTAGALTNIDFETTQRFGALANITADKWFTLVKKNTTSASTFELAGSTLEVKELTAPDGTKSKPGYKKAVKVTVTKNTYCGWAYNTEVSEGANMYTFTVRLMSPLKEGKIATAENKTITLRANDLKNGALIKAEDIFGVDYTGKNTYNIVPDKFNGSNRAWSDPQLAAAVADAGGQMLTPVKVIAGEYMDSAEIVAATQTGTAPNLVDVPGAIKVTAKSISQDCESKLTVIVTDAWGFTLKQEVPVKLVME